jgi:hypothetical protein
MAGDIEAELRQARLAQQSGNPGRARVCARRAAGMAIREFYRKREQAGWGGDALKQLQRLSEDESAPDEIRQAAVRLTTKVDENHQLPFTEDPVEDAQEIIGFVRVSL